MGKKYVSMVVVMFMVLAILAGCATNGYYNPATSAGVGALGGAATGAALGSVIGAGVGGGRGAGTGAWVGAASGAILGGAGGYLYSENRNNQRANMPTAPPPYGSQAPAPGYSSNMPPSSPNYNTPAPVYQSGVQTPVTPAY